MGLEVLGCICPCCVHRLLKVHLWKYYTFSELSVFVAIVCHVTVMWCQSVMVDDMYHVPITCMVLEICDKVQKVTFLHL